jgi:NAD(P)-dependent dehydrogenase (short-subunit alcohol dehydrogenase family)
MELDGQNVVITGGSRGLGLFIVDSFLRSGCNVVFCARSGSEVESAVNSLRPVVCSGRTVIGLRCDVRLEEDVDLLFREADQLGKIDIVINNAGTYGPIARLEEASLSKWVETFEINLFAAARVLQRAIPRMKSRGRGKLIQISGGGVGPVPGCTAYQASKYALVRLTETVAEELRPWNIDCNAVAPGPMNTRMLEAVLSAGPETTSEAFFRQNMEWSKGTGAEVSPALAAKLCLFLASDRSSGITGRLISAVWDPWENLFEHREDVTGDVYALRRIVPADRGLRWDSR